MKTKTRWTIKRFGTSWAIVWWIGTISDSKIYKTLMGANKYGLKRFGSNKFVETSL